MLITNNDDISTTSTDNKPTSLSTECSTTPPDDPSDFATTTDDSAPKSITLLTLTTPTSTTTSIEGSKLLPNIHQILQRQPMIQQHQQPMKHHLHLQNHPNLQLYLKIMICHVIHQMRVVPLFTIFRMNAAHLIIIGVMMDFVTELVAHCLKNNALHPYAIYLQKFVIGMKNVKRIQPSNHVINLQRYHL